MFIFLAEFFEAQNLKIFGNSLLLTALWAIIYSVILAIILVIIYNLALPLFKKLEEKMSWLLAAFVTSFIFVFIFVIIVYFLPNLFWNWSFTAYDLAESKFRFFLQLLGSLLYSTLVISVVIQPLVFLGSFLQKKFKYNSNLLNTILSMFVIALIITISFALFPWILGGLLTIIFF